MLRAVGDAVPVRRKRSYPPYAAAAHRTSLVRGLRALALTGQASDVRAPSSERMSRGDVLWLLLLLGIFAVAAWVRISHFREVFVGKEVLPGEMDCYHHLRRMLRALADFPHVPSFDPLLNWPEGGHSAWPPGFDQLGALLAVVTGSAGDLAEAAHAIVYLPVLLGLVAILVTMRLQSRLLEDAPDVPWLALGAGLVFALLPQSISISSLARTDHHVLEAMDVGLLTLWLLWSLDLSVMPSAAKLGSAVRFEIAGALLVTASIHCFGGTLLYVGIATAVQIGVSLWAPTSAGAHARRLLGSGGPAFAAAAVALALLARPQVAAHGNVIHHFYPSYLQPILVAVGAVGASLSALAAGILRAEAPHSPARYPGPALVARRTLLLAGTALPLLLGVAAAVPHGSAEVVTGLRDWLGKQDPYMASIDECRPLFMPGSIFSAAAWTRIYQYYGYIGLLSPVFMPLGAWEALRENRGRGACFIGVTLPVLGLTLEQSRFGRALIICIAIWTVLGLRCIGRTLVARTALARGAWAAEGRGTGAFVLAALALAVAVDARLRLFFPEAPGGELSPIAEASIFLRDHTPAVKAGARSGVLSPWDLGFVVMQLAERPVASSGFGPYISRASYDAVEAAWRGDEAQMVALMDARDLGYVVAGAANIATGVRPPDGRIAFSQGGLDAEYFQRVPLSPLIIGGSGIPELGVRHLAHLSPRFASTQLVSGVAAPVPRLWVFERVAGARLVGSAAPGATIVARLALDANGHSITYVAWARVPPGAVASGAGASGAVASGAGAAAPGADAAPARFELILPTPTGLDLPELRSAASYAVSIEGGPAVSVEVPERAVQEGLVIELEPRASQ